MPLVAYKDLPTFQRLKDEGRNVLPPERAAQQEIRELHIGLLNMMPDAALEATERQFFRLIGESNQIAQFYLHPFSLPELERSDEANAYIKKYYEPFEKLQDEGLDALIISGASVTDQALENNAFWEPLQNVMGWAWDNVTSTICSCLATHAIMQFRYEQQRTHMGEKLWGVYRHRVMDREHPIVKGMNTVFDVPHSRFNDVSEAQFEDAGMKVLVKSERAGVHLAVSQDGFRMVCLQGHSEYDTESLLKEYKREIQLFVSGEHSEYPPLPENVFNGYAQGILEDYKHEIAKGHKETPFPESDIEDLLDNTWRDSSKSIIGNWIGKVYQVTNMERKKPFMDGIDPNDPLGLKTAA